MYNNKSGSKEIKILCERSTITASFIALSAREHKDRIDENDAERSTKEIWK